MSLGVEFTSTPKSIPSVTISIDGVDPIGQSMVQKIATFPVNISTFLITASAGHFMQ